MEDSLVGRRSKRSTAGNRMEAALAEMSVDDLMQDVEEDIDFISKVDEEDIFESDFASTDDELDEEDAGEKVLQEEEKREKRAARHKSFKVPTAPARRVTFDSPVPEGEATTTSTPKASTKSQRRVSLGQVIDAETGQIMETSKRQSTREATKLNTRELQSRLRHAEGRRISLTKRPKEVKRRKTQAELINAALDMEEGNIKSHREYLVTEEERRKKARVIKPTTVGPKIRWRSRVEDVMVTVYDPAPQQPYQLQRPSWSSPFTPNPTDAAAAAVPNQNPSTVSIPGQPSTTPVPRPFSASQYPIAYATSTTGPATTTSPVSGSKPASVHAPSPAPGPASKHAQANLPTTTPQYTNHYYQYPYYNPQTQTPHSQYQPYGSYYTYQPTSGQYAAPQPPRPHLQLHPHAQVARKTTEKQTKNYVELLIDEDRPKEKPTWRETMDALFGKHADWDSVRVYVGKNRPLARQIQTCPITGLQARYRDPRTGVPFANAGAFRILSRLLAHEYVWSPAGAPGEIGVFVGHEKQRGAVGVPDSWGEAMGGVEEGWRKKGEDGRKEEVKEKEMDIKIGERRSSRVPGGVQVSESIEVDKDTGQDPPESTSLEAHTA